MGAIATVYVDREPERARALLNELARWAEGAIGIDFSWGSSDICEVTFPDSDTHAARGGSYVEQVLAAADPSWRECVKIEMVSTGA